MLTIFKQLYVDYFIAVTYGSFMTLRVLKARMLVAIYGCHIKYKVVNTGCET